MKIKWVSTGMVAVSWAATLGCSSQPLDAAGDDAAGDSIGRVSQAVAVSTYTDVTGRIQVQVKTCDWSTTGTDPESQCTVDSGWTLTGGGAEIENQPVTGSPVLKASFPLQDSLQNTWVARSHGTVSHRIRAYAIGLKLTGLTETQVRSLRYIYDSTTAVLAGVQSISQAVPTDYSLVGGGAVVLVPSAPGSLIESRPNPSDTTSWLATIKSTGVGAGVKTYAIALKTCSGLLSDPSWCFNFAFPQTTGSSASGYGTVNYGLPASPWVQTSVGGVANSSNGNRYLADLIPFNGSAPGITARSLNIGTSSGTTGATSVSMRVWAYPWIANTFFIQAGGELYRGSNGHLQTYSYPPGDPFKWALQEKAVGGGIWYLRNQNPGMGGDCAYAPTSTSTSVSINSTCSGTGYEWQVYWGTFNASFILKNRLTGTCIDSNGATGSTATDVMLKACSSSSNKQQIWLDWYNWP